MELPGVVKRNFKAIWGTVLGATLAALAIFLTGCDMALNVVNGDSNQPSASTGLLPDGAACQYDRECQGSLTGGGCNQETGRCE